MKSERNEKLNAGLAKILDILLPGTEKLPGATALDGYSDLLARVFTADPTLEPVVEQASMIASSADHCTLNNLIGWVKDDMERLVFALQAAYYMSSDVRSLLGYPGQGRYPVSTATPDQLASEALLEPVLARGDIFVPTPSPETISHEGAS